MKEGILLINLGTPKNTSTEEVKKYLKTFLSDRRVIKTSPFIWQPILHMILGKRSKKSAKMYEYMKQQIEKTLYDYTMKQKNNLQELLPNCIVEFAMSYSEPSISTVLDKMIKENITKLYIVPMYPQYSGTTVGSVFDEVMRYFLKSDKIVDITFISSFTDNEDYINYYAKKIEQELNSGSWEMVLFSYHGIPVSYVKDGDKYPEECSKTTEEIMTKINKKIPYKQVYQSKFGPKKWLEPATSDTIKRLPKEGIKNVLVIAPGFVTDCLETVLELGVENREYFLNNGGIDYKYIKPFNEDKDFAYMIKKILKL